jgi:hypothetical protein
MSRPEPNPVAVITGGSHLKANVAEGECRNRANFPSKN